jgi:hypothetical protein
MYDKLKIKTYAQLTSNKFFQVQEMTSKNRPQLKPTKPPSGYNIFYQSESKRARDRERARKLYLSRSSCNKPEHEQPANKTRFIGNKWKNLSQHEQELFYIRGKNELGIYQVNKSLWTAADKMSCRHGSTAWDDEGESLHDFCHNVVPKDYIGSLKNQSFYQVIEFLR